MIPRRCIRTWCGHSFVAALALTAVVAVALLATACGGQSIGATGELGQDAPTESDPAWIPSAPARTAQVVAEATEGCAEPVFDGDDLVFLGESPDRNPDFRCADFADRLVKLAQFSGRDMGRADFARATLIEVQFDGSSLAGANFGGATLDGASFEESDLSGADFSHSVFSGVSFEEADLTGANFDGVVLDQVDFDSTICPDGSSSELLGICHLGSS